VPILCEPNQQAAATIVASLGPATQPVATLDEAALRLTSAPDERLVIIGPELPFEKVVEFTRRLRADRPEVAVLLVRMAVDEQTLEAAAAAGITEVVPASDAQQFHDAYGRVMSVLSVFDAEPAEVHHGQILTVFSAKGGCGKTTLATNLAVVLSASGEDRVCLVDLDLDFGDVAISLRLTPSRTLLDAAELQKAAHAAADPIPLHGLTTPFAPGLDCVLAPAEPGDGDRIPAGLVASLLADLRTHYDYVVVDTPSHFSEHVLAALDATDHYLLVTTPELPSLKNLRLTLDMFDLLGYARDKRLIVFNRSDDQTGLTAADIESTVKSPIAAHVPSSRDVPISINKGVPLAQSNPKHPVSLALRNFVNVAVRQETTHAEGRRRGRRDAVRKR
jgi:MinD-like ATPase involved in chromosome partitioning or flagellar assembly